MTLVYVSRRIAKNGEDYVKARFGNIIEWKGKGDGYVMMQHLEKKRSRGNVKDYDQMTKRELDQEIQSNGMQYADANEREDMQ